MHHIIYLSRAVAPFTDAQLHGLLFEARSRNAGLDLTGVLLYGNGQFLQVLEGEEAAVRAVYSAIRRDPRHRDVVACADKEIKARAFAGWSMAFHAATPAQLADVSGYFPPAAWAPDALALHHADRQLLAVLHSFVFPNQVVC